MLGCLPHAWASWTGRVEWADSFALMAPASYEAALPCPPIKTVLGVMAHKLETLNTAILQIQIRKGTDPKKHCCPSKLPALTSKP